MAETYCGKSCKECPQLLENLCPGCKTGPGRKLGGDCKLAACVQQKGHETCDTCGFNTGCARYHGRHQVPEQRRIAIEEEAARKAAFVRRAKVLGKWLWILFWLFIPANIGSLLTHDMVKDTVPALSTAGVLIQLACNLVYGAILLKLASEETGYRTAGFCALISGLGAGVASLIPEHNGMTLLITIPMAIVGIYGQYHEFMSHAAVTEDVDYELSQKWQKLWKWELGLEIGLVCSAFLLIVPLVGLLMVLGIAIGMIVVSILKLVYLYQTAKLFREF